MPSVPRRRPVLVPVLAAAALLAPLGGAGAQTLRGSRESVERARDTAVARGLVFQPSRRAIEQAAAEGRYVRLVDGSGYRLRRVSTPYVLPETAAWVGLLAPLYQVACGGEPMTITSAIRPTTLRFRNSVEESVHPTGMAVDLHAPQGRCRRWLRTALLDMERVGTIDATEERFPIHFHVVVYGAPAVESGGVRAEALPAAAPAAVAPTRP